MPGSVLGCFRANAHAHARTSSTLALTAQSQSPASSPIAKHHHKPDLAKLTTTNTTQNDRLHPTCHRRLSPIRPRSRRPSAHTISRHPRPPRRPPRFVRRPRPDRTAAGTLSTTKETHRTPRKPSRPKPQSRPRRAQHQARNWRSEAGDRRAAFAVAELVL
jgi:hypothetical protein